MRYQQLFLAHGAFKTYEKRSKYYDTYLKNKDGSKWTQPDLPRQEIDQLFDFIIH